LSHDPAFWNALINNIYIVLISVFGQIPLGFLLAYLIFRKLVKWPAFWQGVLYMPAIISSIVIGILWQTIFSPYGPITEFMNNKYKSDYNKTITTVLNQSNGFENKKVLIDGLLKTADTKALESFSSNPKEDLESLVASYETGKISEFKSDMTNLFAKKWSNDFLSKPGWSMIPILFVILWMYTGMYLIIFVANMQKIELSVLESAQLDGANELQIMWHIVVPSLSGVIVTTAILAISGSLRAFDLIFAMTGGGPARATQVLSIYMYENAFLPSGIPNYPLANAISTVMIVISFGLIIITRVIEKRFGGKE
jgi:ABC-type sugar transport system permease subunit